jgi:hypothetical protein
MEFIVMSETSLLETCYQKTEQFVSRQIAGEAVLVPLRPQKGGGDAIYSLNETAASAWALLDGGRSVQMVVAQLMVEYDVSEADAAREVLGLVEELVQMGALEKVA